MISEKDLAELEKISFEQRIERVEKLLEGKSEPRAFELGLLLALKMGQEIREGKELGSESGDLVASWSGKHPDSVVEEAIAFAKEFLMNPAKIADGIKQGVAKQAASADATVVVAEGSRDRIAALEPFFEAMRVQQQWSWDAAYGGGQVTIENSKTIGNCTTFPTASLIRVGLLTEPTIVWPHARHAKAHPEYFERFTPGKTPAQCVADGDLIVGDIVRFSKPMMHSMVYMGWDDERNCPLWNTGGRAGGTQGSRPALFKRLTTYEKGIVDDILRIRTYPVNVSWTGNGIVGGGGEVMAKQNCTVTFDPQPGSSLIKLVVDGTEQPIEPGMRSYTFEGVLEPHSVEVTFQ